MKGPCDRAEGGYDLVDGQVFHEPISLSLGFNSFMYNNEQIRSDHVRTAFLNIMAS